VLQGKNIILGISGGIAAYKAPLIIRLLHTAGASVKVVCTQNALEFTTKTTLETLSEHPVYADVFDRDFVHSTEHISITDWADLMIIAPATGNIIGKFASGIADEALSTTYMAFNGPVFIAPAMNTKMWLSKAVQDNMAEMRNRGHQIIGPDEGNLACGYDGAGRMSQPDEIVDAVKEFFSAESLLEGKTVLITAGPTVENIDPVRFLSNYSSGKMGYAIANEALRQGAKVVLVSGPVNINAPAGVELISVKTAAEMHQVCVDKFADADMAIMAAAVADYRPKDAAEKKIKKSDDEISITFVKNPDILADLGRMKKAGQILGGFALETDHELENAKQKLHNKKADFIVMNSLRDANSAFGYDTNKISVIHASGDVKSFELMTKTEAAKHIIKEAAALIK